MKTLGIKEAKAKFSQTLELAKESPVLITHHGKPCSVIMSYEQYRKTSEKPKTGWDIFKNYNWDGFELVREQGEAREIKF